jgi:hypothetical protein
MTRRFGYLWLLVFLPTFGFAQARCTVLQHGAYWHPIAYTSSDDEAKPIKLRIYDDVEKASQECGKWMKKNAPAMGVLRPDPKLTPGKVRTTDAKEVCHSSTKEFRHTSEPLKAAVYAEYNRTKVPGKCCEVDHLIPLELGGADVKENLWPQPYEPRPGAHEKDKVENYLHNQVCSGVLPLEDAQHFIVRDWYAVYQSRGGMK